MKIYHLVIPIVVITFAIIFCANLIGFIGHAQLNQTSTSNYQPGSMKYYKNPIMGLSFQYPLHWKNTFDVTSDCVTKNNCVAIFMFTDNIQGGLVDPKKSMADPKKSTSIYTISVASVRLNESILSDPPCNCNSLKDYVTWDYNRTIGQDQFINDNQTKPAQGQSVWQIETIDKTGQNKKYALLTINNGIGYKFVYEAPSDDRFSANLGEFKTIIKSVKFTAPIYPTPKSTFSTQKSPSFLNSDITQK